MKKKGMLTAVIGVIVILVSIYGLMKWKEYKTTEVIEEIETQLNKVSEEEIARVELYNGQALTFVKQEDRWIEEINSGIEYDQDKIDQMVEELAGLRAFQTISNVQDQVVYGIDEQSKIVTIYDKANNPQTFRVGSQVPGQEATYIWSDMDEVIYLVENEQMNDIWWTREDIVEKDMQIPKLEEINQVIITGQDKKIKWIRNTEIGSKGYETWLIEEPFKNVYEIKTDLVEERLKSLSNFSKDKFVTTDGEKLAAYGLDKPSLVLELNGKYTIKFGNTDGEYTYFKCSEEPYIYKMVTEKIKGFKDIDTFELIRKPIYVPKQEALKSIVLKQENQETEWLFESTQEAEANEQKVLEEPKILEQGSSLIGETILDAAQTEKLLNTLGSISIYKPLVNPGFEEKQERTAEISITYNLKNGEHHDFEFVPYDPSFYILRYKGHVEFSVEKKAVITFFNEFKNTLEEVKKEISP